MSQQTYFWISIQHTLNQALKEIFALLCGPRGATPGSRSGGAAVRRYPSSKVRSSSEKIPHIRGKTNPSKMVGVARGHQRGRHTETIITEISQSDHRTTVVSNSVKLSHAMWGHPGWMCYGGEV